MYDISSLRVKHMLQLAGKQRWVGVGSCKYWIERGGRSCQYEVASVYFV